MIIIHQGKILSCNIFFLPALYTTVSLPCFYIVPRLIYHIIYIQYWFMYVSVAYLYLKSLFNYWFSHQTFNHACMWFNFYESIFYSAKEDSSSPRAFQILFLPQLWVSYQTPTLNWVRNTWKNYSICPKNYAWFAQ